MIEVVTMAVLAGWLWREREHRLERRELTNRILYPELVPGRPAPPRRSRHWSDAREAAAAKKRQGPDEL